ncbi:hypothetical protein H9Y04_23650 [Streptomyces sp. TRM66268-LWL]|uniref:DUF1579 domain-containing protein n=1 Tax=Streptomyces polyasparticus TaxID=2767826 RepID=A0ABR7SJD1_9ACTN|nr:hypothetical protein [Streptomyces polyasparticus]MBC9715548.1 hypothetical protein [Streptomyces polyasparticus]
MALLSAAAGEWTGTNGFRLMPDDPLSERPATATLALAAGGHLTSLTYSWEHPDDGPQEGLLVIGRAEDGERGEGAGTLTATWGDSWHQKPAPMTLAGRLAEDGSVGLDARYGEGWGWHIAVTATAEGLRMRMDNVLPPEYATPQVPSYPAMVMELGRTE